jgi:hypothetical protein
VPLGRRFRALKLWAVLRCYGREGLQAMIREHVRLAALFEGWVRGEPGWEICAPRPFSLVCFRRDGSDAENEALLERVNATGEVFLSHTRLDGRYTIRVCIGKHGRRRTTCGCGRPPARGRLDGRRRLLRRSVPLAGHSSPQPATPPQHPVPGPRRPPPR